MEPGGSSGQQDYLVDAPIEDRARTSGQLVVKFHTMSFKCGRAAPC